MPHPLCCVLSLAGRGWYKEQEQGVGQRDFVLPQLRKILICGELSRIQGRKCGDGQLSKRQNATASFESQTAAWVSEIMSRYTGELTLVRVSLRDLFPDASQSGLQTGLRLSEHSFCTLLE